MNIIFPVVSLQQANNIRAQVGLPLLTAWSPKDFTLRDITVGQSSDLVQFISPAEQPPAPPPLPSPVGIPPKIDGYQTRKLLNMEPATRVEVGDLRGVALVVSGGPGVRQISLSEYTGAPLNRQHWVTTDPNMTPVWKDGGPTPRVMVAPGDYVVFRNAPDTHPPKPGKPPRPLDGTPSAVSAG